MKQLDLAETMKVEGKELAIACAHAADENKAENIRVLDVTGLSSLTDFIVICSGNSMPHLKALLRDTEAIVFEKHEVKPYSGEGRAETNWVVLDYFDVMVHIMSEDARGHYDLENLWGDAKEVAWSE
ncbi:ribosome silencing factor [Rubritalea tangerina]